MGASRASRPRSTRRSTTAAVNVLVTLATRTAAPGASRRRVARSARPAAPLQERPRRGASTRSSMPGMRGDVAAVWSSTRRNSPASAARPAGADAAVRAAAVLLGATRANARHVSSRAARMGTGNPASSSWRGADATARLRLEESPIVNIISRTRSVTLPRRPLPPARPPSDRGSARATPRRAVPR